MKIEKKHKKTKCPCCASKEILTMGFDQICLDCNWTNSLMLVELGQLDNPFQAAQHFITQKTFEDLKEEESNDETNLTDDYSSKTKNGFLKQA